MIRLAALGFVLLLVLLPALSSAQTTAAIAAGEEAVAPFGVPDFDARQAPGESVVDLADFVVDHLTQMGSLPEAGQVGTVGGRLRTISAEHVFALLARTAYLWRASGELPAYVPITPDEISPPVLERSDLPAGEFDAEAGEEVLTDQFLDVCGDTVRWIDRLGVIPTAVWVDGVRLSAAQYLAGLAICIQYAYWEGELYETIFLPAYDPPQAWAPVGARDSGSQWIDFAEDGEDEWLGASLPPAGSTLTEADVSSDQWQWEEYEDESEALVPLSPPPGIAAVPRGTPEMVLYPEPGATVGGVVDLVVSYRGPEERFVTLEIDGRSRIIKNFPPYGHRWDTSELKPGTHTVRVQILGEADILLIDQVSAFEVVPAGAASSGRRLVDDL